MRDDVDLDAAVSAGLIGEDQALALRNFEARRSGVTAASAERVELTSGAADVMIALALAVLLTLGLTVQMAFPPAGLALAGAILWAGRRITVERRMAAASIVLFFFYAVAVSGMCLGMAWLLMPQRYPPMQPVHLARPELTIIISSVTAAACGLYWRLVRLPIAVCATAVAGLHAATLLLRLVAPGLPASAMIAIHLAWGFILLGMALWWDMTDIRRETIRSRVAFWLHAAAGFYLADASLLVITGLDGTSKSWEALYIANFGVLDPDLAPIFLVIFCLFTLIALIIDRRSLIFASVLHATLVLGIYLDDRLLGGLPLALGAMAGFILVLGMNWQALRARLLEKLPKSLVAQVPRTAVEHEGRRPTRRHLEFAPRRLTPVRQDELRG